jgi:hypothetical protein
MRAAAHLVCCPGPPGQRFSARIRPCLIDDDVHESRSARGCTTPSCSTARLSRASEGTYVLTVLPHTHRDIVNYLRREVRADPEGSPLALESLPPGRSFHAGAIGREFGLHPSQAPRVDDVLIRLGIASEDTGGSVVVAGECAASLRRVFETAGVLYCAVLERCLDDEDARSELFEHTLAVLCALEGPSLGSVAVAPRWTAFLDSLEARCRNPLLRSLISDVRLQMAFFIRPFVDDFSYEGGLRGLSILGEGIRDNDALIAVEGFQLAWRGWDAELGRMAETRSLRARSMASSRPASAGLHLS